MDQVRACRICLTTGVKMNDLRCYPLVNYFESIAGLNAPAAMDLPPYACYECTAYIRNTFLFREKCLRGQSTLYNMLRLIGKITETSIKSVDRLHLNLISNIKYNVLPNLNIHVLHEKPDVCEIKLEPSNEVILQENNEEAEVSYFKAGMEFTNIDSPLPPSQLVEAEGTSQKKDPPEGTVQRRKRGRPRTNQEGPAKKDRTAISRQTKMTGEVDDNDIDLKEFVTIIKLTKEEQLKEITKRQTSSNYQNARYKCNLCFKCFIDTDAWEHHVSKHQPINKPATATSATRQQPADAEVMIMQSEDSLPQFKAEKEDETSPLTQEAESTSVIICTKSIESKVDALTTTVTNIQNNQEVLCTNQMLVLEKLANISTQISEFMERISEKIVAGKSEKDVKIFNHITNKKSLDDFEESLKNKHKAQEFKKALSIVCGKGKGKAINNAYALLDAMFDREFLVGCSWSGGTRAVGGSKICFKSYQNTIDMFFEIVHMSDDSFTIQECNAFLKNILKNAKKRQNSKSLRIPHQKKRGKKLKKNTAFPRPDEETQAAEDDQLNNSILLHNEKNETIENANVDDVNEDVESETGENGEEEMLDLC